MTPANNSSIQSTVRQLKEIIMNLRGEEHEAFLLVSQMENLVLEIERKANSNGQFAPVLNPASTKISG